MNEQLTLISTEIPLGPVKITPNLGSIKRNKRQQIPAHRPKYAIGNQNWWKLSQEEKELGLAGVRNIRSILQKYSQNDQNSIAKAS